MTAKPIVERALVEVFGGGDLDALPELYAPDVAAPVRQVVMELRDAFPDLAIAIDIMVEEGDELAARFTATGTQRGWFRGVPPTAARLTWTGSAIFVIGDGKIVLQRTSWDVFGLVQQLRGALG